MTDIIASVVFDDGSYGTPVSGTTLPSGLAYSSTDHAYEGSVTQTYQGPLTFTNGTYTVSLPVVISSTTSSSSDSFYLQQFQKIIAFLELKLNTRYQSLIDEVLFYEAIVLMIDHLTILYSDVYVDMLITLFKTASESLIEERQFLQDIQFIDTRHREKLMTIYTILRSYTKSHTVTLDINHLRSLGLQQFGIYMSSKVH